MNNACSSGSLQWRTRLSIYKYSVRVRVSNWSRLLKKEGEIEEEEEFQSRDTNKLSFYITEGH